MSTPFELYCEDLRFNRTRSPWAQSAGLRGWLRALENEVVEVRDEITPEAGAPRLQHAAEEMGDVLGNWISLSLAIEAAGGPTVEDIVTAARAKLHARKPWVFDGSPVFATADEEHAAYAVNKAKLKDLATKPVVSPKLPKVTECSGCDGTGLQDACCRPYECPDCDGTGGVEL